MSVGQFLNNASLPGLTSGKTFARFRVWKDSRRGPVRFVPLGSNRTESRRMAARLFHDARRFERQTRTAGKQDGAIGRNGLAILQALLFDFLNHMTGQLDPSYEAIARAANISIRSVARGVKKLRAAGVLSWERRCDESVEDGRYVLRQDTNAYAVLLASFWRGFKRPAPAPAPEAGTWGDHPPMASGAAAAAEVFKEGGGIRAATEAMAADPGDGLGQSLARLARRALPKHF